jgi:hypothetical protein
VPELNREEVARRVEAGEWEKTHANGDNHGENASGVYLVRAADIEPERVEYLTEPTIPLRVVTLVVGLDGVGKSTVLYDLAARATRGQLNGRFRGIPVDVVVASSEDHPGSVIVPRLIAAGAAIERAHIVKVERDGLTGDIALPDDLDALADEVKRVRARFLIVDPLVAHLRLTIDSHKAQHVRSVLAPLAHLAEDAELAVGAVVHFNGAASTDVRSRISGSKALRDASRSVLVCGPDQETSLGSSWCRTSTRSGPGRGPGAHTGSRGRRSRITATSTRRRGWCGLAKLRSIAAGYWPDRRRPRNAARTRRPRICSRISWPRVAARCLCPRRTRLHAHTVCTKRRCNVHAVH